MPSTHLVAEEVVSGRERLGDVDGPAAGVHAFSHLRSPHEKICVRSSHVLLSAMSSPWAQ